MEKCVCNRIEEAITAVQILCFMNFEMKKNKDYSKICKIRDNGTWKDENSEDYKFLNNILTDAFMAEVEKKIKKYGKKFRK